MVTSMLEKKTVTQLAHDDWGGLYDEIEAGGQVHTIEYKKEEPINFNHMIFNPVHVNRELSVDIGLALEGMASINLDIRYYSHLCISNSTENKSVRAFVPTYE